MSMKIFVGNLPYDTTERALQDLFAEFGNVESATIILDRVTGRSRGFGFVEMASQEEGERAIKELNGKEFEGRTLTVNEARPRENRNDRGGFRDAARGSFGGRREPRW